MMMTIVEMNIHSGISALFFPMMEASSPFFTPTLLENKANGAITSLQYNGEYWHSSSVTNKANGAITYLSYNREYWQNWRPFNGEQQAPNTNVGQTASPVEMKSERQAPNTNVGQTASPDELESEWRAPDTNIGQKTLISHSNGEHSIDILKFLSSLKTNQFYQRMMIL